MFDFLLPTYVVAAWNEHAQDFSFLCAFNSHFIPLANADKFYFRFTARAALEKHCRQLEQAGIWPRYEAYQIVDYRELGFDSEDARGTRKYTFG